MLFRDEVSRACQSGAIKLRYDLSELNPIWGIPSKLSIRGYQVDKSLQVFINQGLSRREIYSKFIQLGAVMSRFNGSLQESYNQETIYFVTQDIGAGDLMSYCGMYILVLYLAHILS